MADPDRQLKIELAVEVGPMKLVVEFSVEIGSGERLELVELAERQSEALLGI